jgi:putative ABC transport system substrate-binding protein
VFAPLKSAAIRMKVVDATMASGIAVFMKRRAFIAALGGVAASLPLAARAQQPAGKVPRVGVLMNTNEGQPEGKMRIDAFRQALQRAGWVEGRNIQTDYRWATDLEHVSRATAEMVASSPDVIVANGTPFMVAVARATRTIPVVFALSNDPVGSGHIASMAHPGGNITGFTFMEMSLIGKWIDMLKQASPGLQRTALLYNADTTPYYIPFLREVANTPSMLPLPLIEAEFSDGQNLPGWIEAFARAPGGSLVVPASPFNVVNGQRLAELAGQFKLPAISIYRQFAVDGGLMAYGPDPADIFVRTADYVDRILKGARPGDLPAQSPIKFLLTINVKTARALELTIPPTLLATADEVIE